MSNLRAKKQILQNIQSATVEEIDNLPYEWKKLALNHACIHSCGKLIQHIISKYEIFPSLDSTIHLCLTNDTENIKFIIQRNSDFMEDMIHMCLRYYSYNMLKVLLTSNWSAKMSTDHIISEFGSLKLIKLMQVAHTRIKQDNPNCILSAMILSDLKILNYLIFKNYKIDQESFQTKLVTISNRTSLWFRDTPIIFGRSVFQILTCRPQLINPDTRKNIYVKLWFLRVILVLMR